MKQIVLALISAFVTTTLCAQNTTNTTKDNTTVKWSSARPDGHAPINVMADHTHHKGEWMFSYRYMYMNMEDMKNGADDISTDAVHAAGYMVSPLQMTMKMHMLGVMHAVSDKVTLMAMFNYIDNNMDLQMKMDMNGMAMTTPFSTTSSGLGDTKVSVLYQFLNKNRQELHGMLGVVLPTGSIDEKDYTAMSTNTKVILPYSMQLGSGSVGADVGLTYLGQATFVSWGAQAKATLYFGDNSNDYRLGNVYNINAWFAVKTTKWLSISARAEGKVVDKISGANASLMPMMVTTANTANSGGTYVNAALGINTYIPGGALKNLRFGVEVGYPAYQNVNGLQLGNKESIMFGTQYSFGSGRHAAH